MLHSSSSFNNKKPCTCITCNALSQNLATISEGRRGVQEEDPAQKSITSRPPIAQFVPVHCSPSLSGNGTASPYSSGSEAAHWPNFKSCFSSETGAAPHAAASARRPLPPRRSHDSTGPSPSALSWGGPGAALLDTKRAFPSSVGFSLPLFTPSTCSHTLPASSRGLKSAVRSPMVSADSAFPPEENWDRES